MKSNGIFLTSKSRIEQCNEDGRWWLVDNELFMDNDGSIYLAPRYYKTDNYTIPSCLAWVAGDKAKFDVRPSHQHDVNCSYHKKIKVNLSLSQLRKMDLLKGYKDLIICENIPIQYLEVLPCSKTEADNRFKRMMLATGCITKFRANLLRTGVFFNVGWWLSKPKELKLEDLYKKDKVN